MHEAVSQPTYYTADEFLTALTGLSPVDKARSLKIAAVCALGTGLAGDDLFQEAVVRSLQEDRRWPCGVSLLAFLANAMRSIADSKRKELRRERDRNKMATFMNAPPVSDAMSDVEHHCAQVEHEAQCKQLVGELMALFEQDEEAQWVLIGDLDGCTPSEICGQMSIDLAKLATIRRRIRRKIDSAYPKGRRP